MIRMKTTTRLSIGFHRSMQIKQQKVRLQNLCLLWPIFMHTARRSRSVGMQLQGHLGIVSTRIREAFTVISAIRMEHPSLMTTSKLIRALLHVVMTTSLNKQRALSVQRLRMAELVIGLRGSPRCLRIS